MKVYTLKTKSLASQYKEVLKAKEKGFTHIRDNSLRETMEIIDAVLSYCPKG